MAERTAVRQKLFTVEDLLTSFVTSADLERHQNVPKMALQQILFGTWGSVANVIVATPARLPMGAQLRTINYHTIRPHTMDFVGSLSPGGSTSRDSGNGSGYPLGLFDSPDLPLLPTLQKGRENPGLIEVPVKAVYPKEQVKSRNCVWSLRYML
ncbi:hypothetical protein LTR93_011309 [Exophiala xenobiotica]|nr:hypothetical protein LTR93_011309 [Exophiala xenobiotica]